MNVASPKTILLIEDDNDIRAVYSEVLRDAGFEVVEEAGGDMGGERALQGNWDLLLLDIMLPGQDGVQILKKIKSNELVQNKPVILLTNLGNEHIINECFDLGADGYLIKSQITPDKIVSEVSNYLTV